MLTTIARKLRGPRATEPSRGWLDDVDASRFRRAIRVANLLHVPIIFFLFFFFLDKFSTIFILFILFLLTLLTFFILSFYKKNNFSLAVSRQRLSNRYEASVS